MKYDRNLSEIFQMETKRHAEATERFADKVTVVCLILIVVLLKWGGL